jgi:predicted transposase YbfD/YdcC
MRQQNRQAVTKAAVLRRLGDAELDRLPDRRDRRGRRHPYLGLVMALALGAVAALRSLRTVEALTAGLPLVERRCSRIAGRISDTKLRDTLLGLRPEELRQALHRQVKAEHRRGHLAPTRLSFGVVAIDGKGLGKLDEWGHPDVQPIRPDGRSPYGLARVHRAHLVSSDATVCLDERPIPGRTNELGAVCSFTKELIGAYRHTALFEVITADAGNSSLKHASLIHGYNLGYVLAVKEPLAELHREALRRLSDLRPEQAEVSETRRERGARITHRLFRVTIRGFLGWTHARQLVRVERRIEHKNGDTTVGNRYFVTNLVTGRLDGRGWLTLVRMHWRCENEGHWTADVVWKEDARRRPWIRVPHAVYALSLVRMIALNILAVLRRMSRRGYTSRSIPWREMARLAYFALAGPALVLSERLIFE